MIVADPRRLESANKRLRDVQAADFARVRSTGQLVIVVSIDEAKGLATVAWDGNHDELPFSALSIVPPGGRDFDARRDP